MTLQQAAREHTHHVAHEDNRELDRIHLNAWTMSTSRQAWRVRGVACGKTMIHEASRLQHTCGCSYTYRYFTIAPTTIALADCTEMYTATGLAPSNGTSLALVCCC